MLASPVRSSRGSSPLTRGKQLRGAGVECWWGLIPAHAGKTSLLQPLPPQPAAHPRSRGENSDETAEILQYDGSSPLTRGKHGITSRNKAQAGLIPAHAGKTPRAQSRAPRPTGSSPLTRGKRQALSVDGADGGLIPAHAGKTADHRLPGRCAGAHPRSRGENHTKRRAYFPLRGSSPLTRGKQR